MSDDISNAGPNPTQGSDDEEEAGASQPRGSCLKQDWGQGCLVRGNEVASRLSRTQLLVQNVVLLNDVQVQV